MSEAKCEVEGKGKYTVTFANEAFATQIKEVAIPAISHSWGAPTYEWSSDNKQCTATRVCANDASHVEAETANSVLDVQEAATCTQDGYGKYTATFANSAFEAQEQYGIIARLDHDYKFDSFVWADDFTAKAKYVCSHDASHEEFYDAEVTSAVTAEPACETEGVRTYTASYDGHTDTKTETLASHHVLTHHVAVAPTCTEEGNVEHWTCDVCGKNFLDENGKNEVPAANIVVAATGHDVEHVQAKAPTCDEDGNVEHYHCNNCGKNASDAEMINEIADVAVSATGHDWGAASYEWNADHTKCTATHVCLTDGDHTESEEVEAELGELACTDCYRYGMVASFTKDGFEAQIYDYLRFTLNNDNASYTVYKGNHLPANVVIPSTINQLPVTRIGDHGFYDTDMSSIFIPNTIIAIDDDAISYCGNLSSIVFEEGSSLQSIGVCGIYNNGSLSSLTLPASLTGIAWWGLAENYHLNTINYLGTMNQWRAIGKGEDWNEGTPGCGAIHCTDGDVDDHYVDWDDWDDDDWDDWDD